MTYRLAKSLETLRSQINTLFPHRSRVSDGWIGNAEHASRESDHNPWVKDSKGVGVVTAIDITLDKDPTDGEGVDCSKLAAILLKNRDPRIKYIIWNRQICSSKQTPWKWRPYTGKNAHQHHLHISVDASERLFDDARRWDLTGLDKSATNKFPIASSEVATSNTSATVIPSVPAIGETAENSPNRVAGENSAENSAGVETTKSETVKSPDGEAKNEVTKKNEQNVNDPAPINEPAPQGFKGKLTAGIATVLGGTILYDSLGKIAGIQFSIQSVYIICFVLFLGFLGFCVWAVLDTWKKNKKTELEVLANTAIDRKNIVWVKPGQQ